MYGRFKQELLERQRRFSTFYQGETTSKVTSVLQPAYDWAGTTGFQKGPKFKPQNML